MSDFSFPNPLAEVVFMRTYSRNGESFPECVDRVLRGAREIGVDYSQDEIDRLRSYMLSFKASFSGRALWQLGTEMPSITGNASLSNCSMKAIETVEDFADVMTLLMLGSGVGSNVQGITIKKLPAIKTRAAVERVESNGDFIVPDDREGWVDLLRRTLRAYLVSGQSFTYSTEKVRPAGAPLKTFGGVASGPEPLAAGIAKICGVLDKRAPGEKLHSLDVVDVLNIIGELVVSGSSRRSAQLCLGDGTDSEFLAAKNWSVGDVPAWRSQSNNSVSIDRFENIPDEVWASYEGGAEPIGFVNLDLSKKIGRLGDPSPDPTIVVTNPCSEVVGPNNSVCNLATIFLPHIESQEELEDISKLLYRFQKTVATLHHPLARFETTINAESRLGQSVTGVWDATEDQRAWLAPTYEALRSFDVAYSAENELPESIRLTSVQPSGTLSLLAGVAPGVHPGHSPFYLRRVRFLASDPLAQQCKAAGLNVVTDIGIDGKPNHSSLVVEFPCRAIGKTKADISAVEMLEMQRELQANWADQSVSITVTFKPDELVQIKSWLSDNYENRVKATSFLPWFDDDGFHLPPYEEISEEEYNAIMANVDENYSFSAQTTSDVIDECANGACPVR